MSEEYSKYYSKTKDEKRQWKEGKNVPPASIKFSGTSCTTITAASETWQEKKISTHDDRPQKPSGIHEQESGAVKCLSHEELLKASRRALHKHLQNKYHSSNHQEITTPCSTLTSWTSSVDAVRCQETKENGDRAKKITRTADKSTASTFQTQALELLKDDPELVKAVLHVANAARQNSRGRNKGVFANHEGEKQDSNNSDDDLLPVSVNDSGDNLSSEQIMIQNAAKVISDTAQMLHKSVKVVSDSSGIPETECSTFRATSTARSNRNEYEHHEDSSKARHEKERKEDFIDEKGSAEYRRPHYLSDEKISASSLLPECGNQEDLIRRQQASAAKEWAKADSSSSASSEDIPSSLSSGASAHGDKTMKRQHSHSLKNKAPSSLSSSTNSPVHAALAAPQEDDTSDSVDEPSKKKKKKKKLRTGDITDMEYRLKWERMFHERPDSSDVQGTTGWLLELFDIATLSSQAAAAASRTARTSVSSSAYDHNGFDTTDKDSKGKR